MLSMPPLAVPVVGLGLLFSTGALFLWLGVRARRKFAEFVRAGTRTDGVVIAQEKVYVRNAEGSGDETRFRITFEYRDHRGNGHRSSFVTLGNINPPQVGSVTPVVYNNNEPSIVRSERVGVTTIRLWFGFGAGLLALSVVLGVAAAVAYTG